MLRNSVFLSLGCCISRYERIACLHHSGGLGHLAHEVKWKQNGCVSFTAFLISDSHAQFLLQISCCGTAFETKCHSSQFRRHGEERRLTKWWVCLWAKSGQSVARQAINVTHNKLCYVKEHTQYHGVKLNV